MEYMLSLLPPRFDPADLDTALASLLRDHLTRASSDAMVDYIRWIVACNYQLDFPADRPLAERVVHPSGPDETNGIEDARLTRFVDDDGSVTYYGTYTGFDGSNVASHLLQTSDFQHFEMSRLVGAAARDKGMALFPRRVHGSFLMLSRSDRETIGVASSSDVRTWRTATTVQAPQQPWEAIQLGNCGPPIETPAGWLVLTHGVGPMRSYAMGAILLDLDDPTRLLGALSEPLLTPADDEREGYVPNVVYSCGAMVHGPHLVMPYGCSDSSIRFARVPVSDLLAQLLT